MPSLGHVAVGLAAGRFHAGAGRARLVPTLVFTALATFPDLDVFARPLGALRSSAWLHRGALHSLAAAAAAGLATALLAGGLGRTRLRMAATAALVAASHGVLDAFTHGARGVMLAWPLDGARWLAPWPFLPAAPIGLRLLSARGVEVLLREAVAFSPLLLFALWPGWPAAPAAAAAAAAPPAGPAPRDAR